MADAIRLEIQRGTWPEWTPSERELSRSLHISRNTCRSALHLLYRQQLIEPVQGRGNRVVADRLGPKSGRLPQVHSVGVILPEALARIRPTMALTIEELQAELFDMQVRLQIHNSPAYYAGNPSRALEKLVARNSHDCWIVLLSHRALQQWFMDRAIPCVISGSVYPGIELPSVDYDFRAVCRHAMGRLLSLGHRRIVFLNRQLRAAGDLESEAGFLEAVKASSDEKLDARVVYHDDQMESVAHLIRQMYKGKSAAPPTALIVANSFSYLSAASTLADCGLRVPHDVSLISRDDDPFLSYVNPVPARYIYEAQGLARKLMLLIRSVLEKGEVKREAVRLMPNFTAGGSVRSL